MSWIREYWRVSFLVVLLLLSAVSLFAPGLGPQEAPDDGTGLQTQDSLTNLQYGLDLSGGARVRATVDGTTAEVPSFEPDEEADIATNVSQSLGVDRADVGARAGPQGEPSTVEAFGDVNREEFREALSEVGLESTNVRDGVTAQTRQEVIETLRVKIDATGFAAASVQEVESQTNDDVFIVVQAANRNLTDVRALLQSRGVVQVLAYYPDEDGTQQNATILTQQQLMRGQIGIPTRTEPPNEQPAVPVTLDEDTARSFQEDMVTYGFTDQGAASACNYPDGGYCLLTVRDGEVVYSAGVRQSLATSFESGDFANDPSFIITATSMEEARQLYGDLQAGSLPAPLTVEDSYFVSSRLGETFKANSWITGLAAALAVSLVVFLRYGEIKVAVPMVLTALSEVAILLGFAAAVGLALDLSHIAGFIAVIGTGVDDLIIIADEVMTERISSRRVFKSRFRKALWIIGAAAATTIIAMSPLAVLSLGDLRGFAIITILGVLIGVIITRPAYGDILRQLLTEEH